MKRKSTSTVRVVTLRVDGQDLAQDALAEIERASVLGYQVDLGEIQDVLRDIADAAPADDECEDCAIYGTNIHEIRRMNIGSLDEAITLFADLFAHAGSNHLEAKTEAVDALGKLYAIMKSRELDNQKT